jgi:hypothetical protein
VLGGSSLVGVLRGTPKRTSPRDRGEAFGSGAGVVFINDHLSCSMLKCGELVTKLRSSIIKLDEIPREDAGIRCVNNSCYSFLIAVRLECRRKHILDTCASMVISRSRF